MEPFSGIRTFLRQPIFTPGQASGDVGIVGIPFDRGVTNRPGARFGPSAIRQASMMLCEESNPYSGSTPTKDLKIFDCGDFDITNIYIIKEQMVKLLGQFSQVISLGGDHTISLPILRALHQKHGPVRLVHFDAHSDARNDNGGLSIDHGTPFYRAIQDRLIIPEESIQIGIRALTNSRQRNFVEESGISIISAREVHECGIDWVVHLCNDQWEQQKPIYLTIDIDCVDPSQAPGTGTPEVGGLFTWQILAILNDLRKDLNWVGMDVVEVAPAYDVSEITSLAAATFIRQYLCIQEENK